MGPRFGSSDVIWPSASPRAISHPRTQNSVPYNAYIPTSMLYIIHIYMFCVCTCGHEKVYIHFRRCCFKKRRVHVQTLLRGYNAVLANGRKQSHLQRVCFELGSFKVFGCYIYIYFFFYQQEDGKEQLQVLTALGLCFSKSFHVVSCTGYKEQKCSNQSLIIYPS